ncbi:hypothetical protein Taro_052397 [Colocasia esculenta]|uniref:Uncharacterized protein n=1 Tax=Colocasia esculenta TaxID=4460 RepID=A0A843XJL6_COLES|nr:hypothetical protein [Colocasia esculenta]
MGDAQPAMASSGAEQVSSFAFPSSSGISRRPGHGVPPPPTPRGRGGRPLALHPDIDLPPPPLRPAFQRLAFALILFFAALQFLPATHFRDPYDPLRRWIPFVSEPGSSSVSPLFSPFFGHLILAFPAVLPPLKDFAAILYPSWDFCNSSISGYFCKIREKVHFHFLISENEEEKASYYKLKVLFPYGNFNIIGQKEIKDGTKSAVTSDKWLWPSVRDVVPLVIPNIYPFLSRFIYVSPNTIMKGRVEELFGINLGTYAIAAVEDCSRSLGSYTEISVLNTIQRTAAKSWVSEKPYDANTCTPDFNVLLIDAKNLDKYLMEAFFCGYGTNPSIMVTLSEKYLKLPSIWKFVPKSPQVDDEINVIGYDGEMRICSDIEPEHQELSFGDIWRQYLPPKSEIILGHPN